MMKHKFEITNAPILIFVHFCQGTWKIVKAVKCGISGIHLVLGTVSLGVGAVSSIPLLGGS